MSLKDNYGRSVKNLISLQILNYLMENSSPKTGMVKVNLSINSITREMRMFKGFYSLVSPKRSTKQKEEKINLTLIFEFFLLFFFILFKTLDPQRQQFGDGFFFAFFVERNESLSFLGVTFQRKIKVEAGRFERVIQRKTDHKRVNQEAFGRKIARKKVTKNVHFIKTKIKRVFERKKLTFNQKNSFKRTQISFYHCTE